MAEVVKVKFEAKYDTHNVRANRSIDVKFKLPYTELVNYIKSLQMLNENITIAARIGSDKPKKIGTYMIKTLNISGDGEAKFQVNSMLDYVNSKAVNDLAERSDEPLVIMLKAEIEGDEEEAPEDAENDSDGESEE